ncbi:MAG: PQQ-binding-like beta-propeller repeat protein [Thermoplasmatales archaeon]|nr:MAG: PQQ-binding-like beta-propeller repeat protein [Thermoplasmatales archaeon]
MRKKLIKCLKAMKVTITIFMLILAVSIGSSIKNEETEPIYETLGNLGGEPIWIYDSYLYIKHIETAQLNGGGALDIIAAEYDMDNYDDPSNVYGIDGSNGDTLWSYGVGDGIRSMAIGDINNDGVMDAVAGASKGSSTPDGKVHAIDGGTGSEIWTFTPGSSGDTNGDVAIGDFDGDEYPDVAVACWDDYVYAINGSNGDELWSTEIGSIFIHAVDTGDVNGDGIDDVAYGHSYLAGWDNYFGVLDGTDGSTIWSQTVDYPIVEGGVMIEDIDDDGDLEAIFGNRTGQIFVRNASNGNLEWEYNIGPVGSPTNYDMYLFTYDIDDDSDLDLIVGNNYGNKYIYAFDGTTNSTIWKSDELNGYPKDISFGDVDGDGNLNIIAATYDRVQILEANNGALSWYYAVAGTIAAVGSADLDGDSIMDTIAGGGAEFDGSDPAKSIWALKTVQSPLLWEFDFGEYGNALAIDDLNQDEFMDVIAVCSVDDTAWAINGEDGSELWNWTGTQNLYSVTTGDFNNDGQIDVTVGGYDEIITALYGNNGSVMWQFTTPTGQIYRNCLKTADLNDDGYCDVIAGSDDSSVYAIDGSDGSELWSSNFGGEVQEIELAQMDGTGPIDVVAAVGWEGNKMVVINGSNGNTLWQYTENTNYARHVEVFDVNNDDILDVAIGVPKMGATPGRLIMVDGDSHDEIWTVTPFLPTSDYALAHGDVNNDGVVDVISAGNSDDKKVHAFNGSNGNELWNFETGGDVNTVAVVDIDFDNQLDVIAGSDDQYVYVIYGNNGSCFWNYSTADDVIHIQIGDISGDGMPNIGCVTFGFDGVVYAFSSFSPAANVPPYTPSNPSPSDGELYVDTNDDLSWTGGDPNPLDTVTYDVYFGTSSPPPKIVTNQSETSYEPGTMNYNTKYYWKIVAWDNNNASTESSIWNFTTEGPNNPPNEPSDPDPENGETNVIIEHDLSWTGGDPDPGDTVTYDVYFGTSSNPPKVSSNQPDTTYDPGDMEFDMTYYWKIVAWDNHDTSTSGDVWSFTTRENNAPNAPSDPDPADGASDVGINDDLSWTCSDPDGDNLTYNVYFEADDPTPDVLVSENQTGTTYDPGQMQYETTYYWLIVAWDNYGASTDGPVWDFTTVSEPNHPPNKPTIFEEGGTLFVYTTDIDEDDVKYFIDWDDGTTTETDYYPSGQNVEIYHDWPGPGVYYIRAMAEDIYGALSDWSDPYEIVIENNPPSVPTIDGPNRGNPGTEYSFTFSSDDTEGDEIYYYIEWGDGTTEDWIGPYASGEEVTVDHTWDEEGSYQIKAKAKDNYDDESGWSEFDVEIPRNRAVKSLFIEIFEKIIERFPNAFPILQYILGLR